MKHQALKASAPKLMNLDAQRKRGVFGARTHLIALRVPTNYKHMKNKPDKGGLEPLDPQGPRDVPRGNLRRFCVLPARNASAFSAFLVLVLVRVPGRKKPVWM